MSNEPEHIVVARFGRPRGVSGELYLNKLSDNPGRLTKPGSFLIENESGWTEVEIQSVKMVSGKPAVRVKGVDSVEKAKKLTGQFIYIARDELAPLPEGQYYYFELVGCRVVNEDGDELGEIVAVDEYPANEVWVVESDEKDANGKNRRSLFPAVKEFVKSVDIKNKVIIITPPEGIFDSSDEN